jgi:hypothetical protein
MIKNVPNPTKYFKGVSLLSLFKAHTSNIDFDRIMALLDLRKFYIIHGLVLLSSTENCRAHCPSVSF